MANEKADKRRKGTYGGLAMIAFGIVSSFVVYYNDSNSMDVIRMMEATNYAILHAVLWTIAGVGVILWYNRPPPDTSFLENRDDNRDGMR